eukprot:5441712-Alexandrium_andersonii.AAC.1
MRKKTVFARRLQERTGPPRPAQGTARACDAHVWCAWLGWQNSTSGATARNIDMQQYPNYEF